MLAALCFGLPAVAAPINIFIDTSALSGQTVDLAFDLTTSVANTLTISAFSTNGTLGASSTIGTVSGTLPGTVSIGGAADFFNEYLQRITLGTTLAFAFTTTAIPAGGTPDEFVFSLLDTVTGLPYFPTTDPIGTDALIRYDIGADNPLALYASLDGTIAPREGTPPSVPEPGELSLVFAALMALGAVVLRKSLNE